MHDAGSPIVDDSIIEEDTSASGNRKMITKNCACIAFMTAVFVSGIAHAQYLGNYSANEYAPNSTSNQFGAGSPYNADSINNRYGRYGSPYSNQSANNPYATDAPKLYDQNGKYHGKLSANPYDPDSTSNPYGRYGSQYSPDSVNNPYGAGSPYSPSSPSNPFGQGMGLYGDGGEE